MSVINVVPTIRPGGGPSGYLYNLKKTTEKYGLEQDVKVYALFETDSKEGKASDLNFINKIKALAGFVPSFFMALLFFLYQFKKISFSKKIIDDLCEEENVVVHDMNMLKFVLKNNSKFKGNIHAMIHSPISPTEEKVKLWTSIFGSSLAWDIFEKILCKRELRMLGMTKSLVMPSPYAMDGYYLKYPKLKSILDKINKSIIPTGVPKCSAVVDKFEIRKQLKVEQNTLLIGFFGRYVSEKGFDLFIDLAKKTKQKNLNINFISGGKGELGKLNSDLNGQPIVKDLGFVNNVHDYINAVDYVIVPNTVAYFDLIILECMSMGKNVLTTSIGGSKSLNRQGVHLIKKESFVDDALEFFKINKYLKKDSILGVYEEDYSDKAFVLAYRNVFS